MGNERGRGCRIAYYRNPANFGTKGLGALSAVFLGGLGRLLLGSLGLLFLLLLHAQTGNDLLEIADRVEVFQVLVVLVIGQHLALDEHFLGLVRFLPELDPFLVQLDHPVMGDLGLLGKVADDLVLPKFKLASVP